jgi:hypothetical protein
LANNLTVDTFLAVDIISAVYGAFVFWFVAFYSNPDTMMDTKKKFRMNAMVAFLLVLVLCRFFILQLVVPNVSKMLLTLVSMLRDVKAFAFLMLCYIIITVQIFSTGYQDTIPEFFGKVFETVKTNFNSLLGGYSY